MQSGMKMRLARLEAAASERPSPFDDMTADELRTWLLDEAERLLTCGDIAEEHRAWLGQILGNLLQQLIELQKLRDAFHLAELAMRSTVHTDASVF
jgi:hypothetical protein